MSSAPSIIIAGGGTGGHVNGGLAVAQAWRKKFGESAKIIFVGARGGIEEKLVPREGYPLALLSLGTLNQVSRSQQIKTFLKLPFAFIRTILLLLKIRPDAVLGVGGYASGPVVLVASLLKFFLKSKTAVLEQNSIAGLTNRILGRYVDRVCVSFPNTIGFGEKPVLITGNPVRASIQKLPSAGRRPFTIFIFGGSQGAVGLNTMVLDMLPHLQKYFKDFRFVHQTGVRDFDRVKSRHEELGTDARVESFIFDMTDVYREASLLICRSGSSTMAEVAAAGRAAIFVPYPHASNDHQEMNARLFFEAGAAKMALENKSPNSAMAAEVIALFKAPHLIDEMERAVRAFYKPQAAEDVVKALL